MVKKRHIYVQFKIDNNSYVRKYYENYGCNIIVNGSLKYFYIYNDELLFFCYNKNKVMVYNKNSGPIIYSTNKPTDWFYKGENYKEEKYWNV